MGTKNQHDMIESTGPSQDAVEPPVHKEDIGEGPVMRTREDDIGIWASIKRYKFVGLLAMMGAFSASLDGYQINLNGGIVSNKGFIKQFAGPGTTIIAGSYISAWGGIQSAGQTVGQILLQFATDAVGRRVALGIIFIDLVLSIFIETFATNWTHWLVAKLFSGIGVGMLQSTMPLYLSEISPTQLRGFYINAYTFWFVLGQLFASVALNRMNATDPDDYKIPIYTQWAMVGAIGMIFAFLPESPWWLVSTGKTEQAVKVLRSINGRVEGYDVEEQVEVMRATVAKERQDAELNSEQGLWAVFQGRNLLRFIIAGWPKVTQQFAGLAVFNTYATYFFQYAGNSNPFQVTIILSCVQILAMIFSTALSDHFGRRRLSVYPYGVAVVCLLCSGIIGCFDYSKKAPSSLLVFFACLSTFATTGASANGYVYAAEIPQQRLRARTIGWALAFSNAIAIMFSFCTPLMINGPNTQWGVKTGFFFAGTGAFAVVVAWFILPEVARRTPAEIDELFEKRVNLRKFDKFVTDVQLRAMEAHKGQEYA